MWSPQTATKPGPFHQLPAHGKRAKCKAIAKHIWTLLKKPRHEKSKFVSRHSEQEKSTTDNGHHASTRTMNRSMRASSGSKSANKKFYSNFRGDAKKNARATYKGKISVPRARKTRGDPQETLAAVFTNENENIRES